jgi:plastocyanin
LGITVRILGAFAVIAMSGGFASSASAESVTVAVGDIYFCDPSFEGQRCVTTITAGDTVVWDFSSAELPHTSTGDTWDSGIIDDGSSFSFTFETEGSYDYLCQIHPTLQLGRIVVGPAATPIATEPQDEPGATTPQPTAPLATAEPATVPSTGGGSSFDGGFGLWWMPVALAALGGIGIALATAMRKQRGS